VTAAPAPTAQAPAAQARAGPRPRLTFTERMVGFVSTTVQGDDYPAGAAQGRDEGSPLDVLLTITYDDLSAVLLDPATPARQIIGTVTAPAVATGPLEITGGEFRLFAPDTTHAETWNMRYHLELEDRAANRWHLDGFKVINNGPRLDMWPDTTTMYTTLERADGSVRAVGILHVRVLDFLKQLTTMTVSGVTDPGLRQRYLLGFFRMFSGTLMRIYGGPIDEAGRFPDPSSDLTKTECARQPKRRHAQELEPEVLWFHDGTWYESARHPGDLASLQLTRYRRSKDPAKGPVLLAPGFAMAASSFRIETVERNLVEELLDHDFDVWLLDYRASICLPSSPDLFTLDQVATEDWPRAIDEVRRVTRADTIQALGHCVGSVTLLMALLSGKAVGVRSAICSGFTAYWATSGWNRFKQRLKVAKVLDTLHIRRVSPDTKLNGPDVALDLLLRAVPLPADQRCHQAVCRWINFAYGLTHRHQQLDDKTHRAIAGMFGVGNIRSFEQIAEMVKARHVVDANGQEAYLPNVQRLANVHMLFLQGPYNYIFHPEGTLKTMRWLRDNNPGGSYQLAEFPGYAHLDLFIGRDASRHVFPTIRDFLLTN
jgi:cholesterol oxidase